MIDSHTHLDLCEPPDAELVAAADEAGRHAHADGRHRRRLLPRGARRGRGVPPGLCGGRAPPERRARASTTPTWPSCARWPRTSAAWRSARPGLDFYRDGAPRADQQRAFAAQIALARETGKPLVIHSREAARETLAQLAAEAQGVQRRDPLLLDARAAAGVPGARLRDLLRGQRHVQERRRAGRGRRAAVPDERLLVETDAPYLTPQAVRKHRNQPAFVAHTAAFVAELRGVSRRAARTPLVERNAARVFGW